MSVAVAIAVLFALYFRCGLEASEASTFPLKERNASADKLAILRINACAELLPDI